MIQRILAAVEVGATALWTGASAGFAFVSAPLAFAIVEDRDAFAQLTERSLARLTSVANISGGVAIAAAAARRSPIRGGLGAIALSLLTYHQRTIVPAMTRAQAAMGSLNEVAPDDQARIAYRAMHQTSTRVFGTALLLGIIQLVAATVDRD